MEVFSIDARIVSDVGDFSLRHVRIILGTESLRWLVFRRSEVVVYTLGYTVGYTLGVSSRSSEECECGVSWRNELPRTLARAGNTRPSPPPQLARKAVQSITRGRPNLVILRLPLSRVLIVVCWKRMSTT